jgi:glycosyltransferase involved in cell wall biosynthesis
VAELIVDAATQKQLSPIVLLVKLQVETGLVSKTVTPTAATLNRAMGCGCPALCADNTSLPEVVRDTAYRFESTSIEALSALLARAADTPLPVSPAFSTSEFDEAQAIRHYVRLFSPAVEDVSQAGSKRHRNTP